MLKYNELPNWLLNLNSDDLEFIKKIIISSGSLKELALDYNVTYPTMRKRIDNLIEKICDNDYVIDDEYTELIKKLALEDKIELSIAKELINEYRFNKSQK